MGNFIQSDMGFLTKSPSPLDGKQEFATILEMKNFDTSWLGNTAMATCDEDGKLYVYNVNNTENDTTGKWEEVGTGGSSGDLTDYQKKTDNTLTTTDKTIVGAINEVKDSIITNYENLTNKPSIEGVELDGNKSLSDLGITIYDDTEVKSDIANLNEYKQNKTDNTLDTTDKTVTGAINEINGNLLDTVSFSADYKNIILNRKNGLNPYTIPISAFINNASLAELKDVDSTDVGNGKTLVYDSSTQKHKYVANIGTDELVKMDSTTDANYLSNLIDKSTVVNDNGVLKVKKLDGQEVTITEINYLKGLTMNVTDLVNAFSNGGVKVWETPVNTYADLSTLDRSTFIDGISYIVYVLIDETHSNAKTTYLCNKTSTTFFGNADSQRNFTTNPIDLANEVTGKLGTSNIDVDSLWTLLTINDTYKTLTTNNEIFGTHGAKAMYDELTTDLTTHTGNANIHVTSVDKAKWNKVIDKVDTTDFNSLKTTVDGKVDKDKIATVLNNSMKVVNLTATAGTWTRIAKFTGNANTCKGATNNSINVILKRAFGNNNTEYLDFDYIGMYSTKKFVVNKQFSDEQTFNTLRYTYDSTNNYCYIEVWRSASSINPLTITLNNTKCLSGTWEIVNEDTTESLTVFTSLDLTTANDVPNSELTNMNTKLIQLETKQIETQKDLEELFQSVSNGKTLVANAITGKGVSTATDATFATMATNIGKISGYKEENKSYNNTSSGVTPITLTFSADVLGVKQVMPPTYSSRITTQTSAEVFTINGKELTFYVNGIGTWKVTALIKA